MNSAQSESVCAKLKAILFGSLFHYWWLAIVRLHKIDSVANFWALKLKQGETGIDQR